VRARNSARVRIPGLASKACKSMLLGIKLPSSLLPATRLPQLTHLPFSLPQALYLVAVNRKTSNKVNRGYYADRLIFIAGMSKSSSQLIEQCIAEMKSIPQMEITYPMYMQSMRPTGDRNLRPELVHTFPNGGILRSHARATADNIFVLKLLDLKKYVIVVRNPADQLAAAYCYLRETLQERDQGLAREAIGDHSSWDYNPMCMIDLSKFQEDLDPEPAINSMLEQGYLHGSLSWITDWLRYRDLQRSIVVKYEDFVTCRVDTLNMLGQFLLGHTLSDDVLARCEALAETRANRRFPVDENIYPRGWSGEVGVSQKYFSELNILEYSSIVNGFLEYYPQSSLLRELYPDLLSMIQTPSAKVI
jgi:hypothetical protein